MSFTSILLALVVVVSLAVLLATPESLFQKATTYIGHYHIGVAAEAYGIIIDPVPPRPKKPQPLQPQLHQPRGRTLQQILENP